MRFPSGLCSTWPQTYAFTPRQVRDVQGNEADHFSKGGEMRFAALTLAFIGAMACSRTPKVEVDPKTGRTDVDIQKPGEPEGWKGTLAAVGGSGITGTATGTTANDATHVTVTITGATPGATLPWHIHDGKCGDASPPVVGDASAYPPLVAGSDGRATGTAHVAVKLNEARNYIVNVHASPTNMGTIVACGDFND